MISIRISVQNLTPETSLLCNHYSHEWGHTWSGHHLMYSWFCTNEQQGERRRFEQANQVRRRLFYYHSHHTLFSNGIKFNTMPPPNIAAWHTRYPCSSYTSVLHSTTHFLPSNTPDTYSNVSTTAQSIF